MPDFNRQIGFAPMPTTAVTGDEAKTLQSLDPAQDIMCDLFKVAMNTDIGPRWNTARLGTHLAERDPIHMAIPVEPTPEFLQSTGTTFPILFIHDDGLPKPVKWTNGKKGWRRTWVLQYVLGPMTSDEVRKLGFAMTYFSFLVHQVVEIEGHPAYAMDLNGVAPKAVLTFEDTGCCGFTEVVVKEDGNTSGGARIGDSTDLYWGATVMLETVQLDGPATAFLNVNQHTGASFHLGGHDSYIEETEFVVAQSVVATDALTTEDDALLTTEDGALLSVE